MLPPCSDGMGGVLGVLGPGFDPPPLIKDPSLYRLRWKLRLRSDPWPGDSIGGEMSKKEKKKKWSTTSLCMSSASYENGFEGKDITAMGATKRTQS